MKVYLPIIFFFLLITSLSSQMINKVGSNLYEYDGKIYRKHNLGFAYDKDSEQMETFLLAKERRKEGLRTLRYSGGVLLGGILMSKFGFDRDDDSVFWMGVIASYIGAPILFVVSISKSRSATKNFKKAIDLYNFDYIERNGYDKDQSYLHIGMTNNGLGLIYSF